MGEIVKLSTREKAVWQCACGCYTFWLYSSGIACCTDCEADAVAMTGFWHLPSETANQQPKAEIVPFERLNHS
jgi:hypothetical protein